MFQRVTLSILCAFMGGVFVFSAYSKLYPIEPFEYTFVDLGIGNWQIAPFIARLLIALEFLIGVLLILNLRLKRFTYKLSVLTLLIFCVYLLLQIIISGNKGNCGCFGTIIEMTPLQALLKNIIMLLVFAGLYKLHQGWNYGKYSKYIVIVLVLVCIALPFILNPIRLNYSESYLNKPETNYKLELDTLYNNALLSSAPKQLSKGKHIISFMSLTCPHCRIAAKKIHIIKERNPEIPVYFVLNGKEENLAAFFKDTHTQNIPYCMLKGNHFIYLAGLSLPSIYLVHNSWVENQLDYMILDQQEVEKWLAKK